MPHIKVSGISKDELYDSIDTLKNIIVDNSNAEMRYVKVFYVPMERIDAKDTPAIDIYWMPRPQEMRDAIATKITACFQQKGYQDVQVTFTEFPGNLFYDNGTHF